MKVKPTEKQLKFMDWEMGMFFHFGIRSFFLGHRDWDNKPMPAEDFMPDELDCEQWCRTARDAGFKYAIMTAKHHDGFANWPSEYTDYSVAASKWKGGKGDVVREFTDACRKYGLGVGIYYSPAQWGTPSYHGKPIDFSEPKSYDDYFINQIGELLTNYGKIDYLWFDGCGSEGHEYDKSRIIKAIRTMQPDIMLFGMWDPDTAWVGNEDGYASSPNPNTVLATNFSMLATEQEKLEAAKFLPNECDFKMRSAWFDCELNEDTIKTTEELVGIYELSVGRGANFLLNIGPSRTGKLPEPDVKRVLEFGETIRRRYGRPVEGFGAPSINENGEYCVSRENGNALVNRVIVKEDIGGGESVKGFKLYAHLPAYTSKRVLVYTGTTIGHKAICLFPTIRTAKLELEITDSDGEAKLSSLEPYFTGSNE